MGGGVALTFHFFNSLDQGFPTFHSVTITQFKNSVFNTVKFQMAK